VEEQEMVTETEMILAAEETRETREIQVIAEVVEKTSWDSILHRRAESSQGCQYCSL